MCVFFEQVGLLYKKKRIFVIPFFKLVLTILYILKNIIMNIRIPLFLTFLFFATNLFSQDPNFHIYLCFGQSNMEGQGNIQAQDRTVDSRFKVMQALDCPNLSRTKGEWYTATPPLCQCYSKLSPADYFGRTMIANLPDSITIGVINVAVGGCDIRLFDKDIYMDYDSTYAESWFTSKVEAYGWNPYQHLIDLAIKAQQDGVIKGILLHQGETNTGQSQWTSYVQKIYTDMLTDLSLDAESVPILAGEVLSVIPNCCSSMNTIINKLPQLVETAYVISSKDCEGSLDAAHFNAEGYRVLGRRYAVQMLSLMGYEAYYMEPECGVVGENWRILSDAAASQKAYVTPQGELTNDVNPLSNTADMITMNVTLAADTTYFVYGRFNNASTDSDAVWIKINDEAFQRVDNLTTTGWEWKELTQANLSAGTHTFTIACAKTGLMVDKLVIKNSNISPVDIGEEAKQECTPEISVGFDMLQNNAGYYLGQNFPNPCYDSTVIPFTLATPEYVSISVFDLQGVELFECVAQEFPAGENSVSCNVATLPSGTYVYRLKTNSYSLHKQFVVKR